MDKIRVLLTKDRELLVEPVAILGDFAVHQMVVHGAAVGPGWVVSHVLTGYSLWQTSTEAFAYAAAEWFHFHGPIIPSEREEAIRWRDGLSMEYRREMARTIQGLAPRL